MTTPRDDATVPWSQAAHAHDPALLAAHAATLRALHHAAEPLVLPNAWDAASARIVAEAGFPAVATTSSGVAASLGWADGEQTPPAEMFAAIARIARVVTVPVTADIEGGYGLGSGGIRRAPAGDGRGGMQHRGHGPFRPGHPARPGRTGGIPRRREAGRTSGGCGYRGERADRCLRAPVRCAGRARDGGHPAGASSIWKPGRIASTRSLSAKKRPSRRWSRAFPGR